MVLSTNLIGAALQITVINFLACDCLHLIDGNWMDAEVQTLDATKENGLIRAKPTAMSLLERHVHFEFAKDVEDLLWERTNHGLIYANASYSHGKFNLDANHIEKYTVFQMLFSLFSDDPLYSLCTMELAQRNAHVKSEGLKQWLVENFNVTDNFVYIAVRNFCKIASLKSTEKFQGLTDLIHQIVQEFTVMDHILFENDTETLTWLVKSGFTISSNFINDAWKYQKMNLIQVIMANNGSHSAGFYEAMASLSMNETFFEFLLKTQSDYVILDIFETSEVSYEAIFRGSLKYNKFSVIKSLDIEDPLDWNKVCDSSLFIDIIVHSNLDALKYMISLGFEINTPDNKDFTLLLRSLELNNTLMTGSILYCGGSVNMVATCNKTLLHTAANHGLLHVSEGLIKLGANLDARDCLGMTPLHAAVLSNKQTFIRYLCLKYVEHNSTAISEIVHFAARNGSQETIETLIGIGPSLHMHDREYTTALDVAIGSCQSNNAFVFIKYGATFNKSQGLSGYLKSAIQCNDSQLLSYLLEKEENETEIKENGALLLSLAVGKRNAKITKLLLEKGVEANGGTLPPIVEAVRKNDIEIIEILKSYRASLVNDRFVLLHEAARQNSLAALEWLISQGRAVDERSKEGGTALGVAARHGSLGALRALLVHGAALNATSSDGLTPLHEAARAGQLFLARELLVRGANPRAKDSLKGWTPLHWAAYGGHQAVVMELTDRGAEVDSTDVTGNTPLHLAAQHGRYPVVLELIERGANLNFRNNLHQTPLYLADNSHHASISKSIRFRGGVL